MAKLRIAIDPKVRVAGQLTFAGYEDVEGNHIPKVGEAVTVYVPGTDKEATALVTELLGGELIYLAPAWRQLFPEKSLPGGLTLP